MNQPHENNEPAEVADLHDRLMDRALAETLGRELPPDLTARILSTATTRGVKRAPTSRKTLTTIGWSILVVAASISIVAATVYLFSDQIAGRGIWRSARVSSARDRGAELEVASPALREEAIGYREQIAGRQEKAQLSANRSRGKLVREMREMSRHPAAQVEAESMAHVPVTSAEQQVPMPAPSSVALPALGERSYFSHLDTLGRSSNGRGGRSGQRRQIGVVVDQGRLADVDALATELAARPFSVHGTGPGSSGDQYTRIHENPFIQATGGDAVSTFSIDVDTASYANVRQFLMDMRQLPPPDAVRIEELVNYFEYDYAGPNSDDAAPFAANVEVAGCPWTPEHRLVRIGVKGREIERDHRPRSNLVFLVDVSGSMDEPNKLPLVVDGLRQLARELGENDRVAIVVYASSEGLALESTRGDHQAAILAALDRLRAGGSTAGGAGIQLAYQLAEDHFIPGGTNRVILCTDGDFNVGVTSTAELERLVTQKAKETGVFLSVLGFGRGNLNDAMMQTIADRGNGNHHYVDNLREARKVLVEEMTGTLITIAKDVKIQVEFNPAQIAGYRLLGYENRLLRIEDFNDDRKDAGEIGAGHTVTALYEVIPTGKPVDLPAADELKYQPSSKVGRTILSVDDAAADTATDKIADPTDILSGELLTLKMRYKEPDGEKSRKLEWPVTDAGTSFSKASDDFQFAAAVASFGLLLRGSEYRGDASYDAVAEIATSSLGSDPHGYRTEFVELVRRAKELQPSR